ncbi:hypothetical protein [Myxococcus hansupus]|uniref:hypothetical protein n=1 Tax=Pseudomyxococcus hansupus TaxID=1297742 RepID=UPI0005D119EE|nr:hypothetical protein [Myxococcus hansupus]
MTMLTKFFAGASFIFALTFAPGVQAQSCADVCTCTSACNTPCQDMGERSRCGSAGMPCVGNCAKADPRASADSQTSSDDAQKACDTQQNADKASTEVES